jgi:hypothetical protein
MVYRKLFFQKVGTKFVFLKELIKQGKKIELFTVHLIFFNAKKTKLR